ncbi:tannase/feruloyl esterase family alpha/beta hydrolase [Novosphingobium sp. SG707]|uniref:tannase/feruloyl esterase family alpha/beta hydrolase n=1 Tax=Novosphingobium sp. SG707 TaxID=2586996 RepID=UPI001445AABD|nr:tannase/feruloyl esterase family alpha/beta hydrolase [Novosphingobium sp. SG707]NKJ02348.1 feruloyl esterase [Novosphingobium sp. SG707]
MSLFKIIKLGMAVSLGAIAWSGAQSSVDAPTSDQFRQRCETLSSLKLRHGTLTSTRYVPAKGEAGGYCDVAATVAPSTDIVVRLPDRWAGRYLHLGGGGMDGFLPKLDVPSSPMVSSGRNLADSGYAVIASNGGHRREDFPDASFAGDRGLLLSYANGKIYDTDMVGSEVVKAIYGEDPRYRYFAGCSNGGRNASTVAADYGDFYDGIIGGDGIWGEAADDVGGADLAGAVTKWVQTAQIGKVFSAAQGAAVVQEQLRLCDPSDGLKDGIIADPESCRIDMRRLQCKPGEAGACLGDAQIEALKLYRTDLVLNGKITGARFGLVDPSFLNDGLARSHLSMISQGGAGSRPGDVDLAREYPNFKRFFEGMLHMSGSLPKIAHYLDRGGKLMIFHGWDDAEVPPYTSVNAFKALNRSYRKAAGNARLYMVPSMAHCRGGDGADASDLIGAMTLWVEKGIAPGTAANPLVAWKRPPAGATPRPGMVGDPLFQSRRTAVLERPLCEYPRTPRYIKGDHNQAASFSCVMPKGTAT